MRSRRCRQDCLRHPNRRATPHRFVQELRSARSNSQEAKLPGGSAIAKQKRLGATLLLSLRARELSYDFDTARLSHLLPQAGEGRDGSARTSQECRCYYVRACRWSLQIMSAELAGTPVLLQSVSHSPASNPAHGSSCADASSRSPPMQRVAALRELRLRSSYSVFKC